MKRLAVLIGALALCAPAAAANKYDGGGGGSTLPACTSAYWGMTINLLGYRWYCASGANHWVIR